MGFYYVFLFSLFIENCRKISISYNSERVVRELHYRTTLPIWILSMLFMLAVLIFYTRCKSSDSRNRISHIKRPLKEYDVFQSILKLQRYSRRCWNAPGAGLPFQNFLPWPANNIQFSVPRAECYHAEMSDSHNIIRNNVNAQKHWVFLASSYCIYLWPPCRKECLVYWDLTLLAGMFGTSFCLYAMNLIKGSLFSKPNCFGIHM